MKTKDTRGIQEKNFVKLWWIEKVNAPFRYACDLIRKKWYSFDKPIFEKAWKTAKKLTLFQLLQESKRLLDSELIQDDIRNLAQEFGFENFWLPYLTGYVLTGRILAPSEKLSKKIPPSSVLEYHKIFLWRVREWADKNKLRKKSYKTRRKKDESKGKYFDDIEDLIHDDSNIADKVFGELEEIPSKKEDIKRSNRVKQAMKRLREHLIPLTPQCKKKLLKIFS